MEFFRPYQQQQKGGIFAGKQLVLTCSISRRISLYAWLIYLLALIFAVSFQHMFYFCKSKQEIDDCNCLNDWLKCKCFNDTFITKHRILVNERLSI